MYLQVLRFPYGEKTSNIIRAIRLDTNVVHGSSQEEKMKNPLDTLAGTVTAGFILTLVLYLIVKALV